MQLHEIGNRKQYPQRVARGGKRGKTSGRGQKGQKSRAGTSMRPAIRDLISRIPKRRGFANKPSVTASFVVSVGPLSRQVAGKGDVTRELLREMKIIPARFRGPVKILANGSVTGAMNLKGLDVSEGARAKIEAAGGSVA